MERKVTEHGPAGVADQPLDEGAAGGSGEGRDGAGRDGARERGIDRVLQVFEFLHGQREPMRIGALAKALRAPRSSIYNIVNLLAQAELLEVGDDGRVFFGKAMYLYGLNYMRENGLVRRGREAVERLSRETGETSELCMLQSGRYTIVHMCQGARPFRISSAPGLQIPLPWTASGRLLLAHLGDAEIRALITDDDLVLPDGRLVAREDFVAAVGEARARGYCVTVGLVDAFTKCIAAPVYGDDGTVEATVCFVVSRDTSEARTEELASLLVTAGRALSLTRPDGPGG